MTVKPTYRTATRCLEVHELGSAPLVPNDAAFFLRPHLIRTHLFSPCIQHPIRTPSLQPRSCRLVGLCCVFLASVISCAIQSAPCHALLVRAHLASYLGKGSNQERKHLKCLAVQHVWRNRGRYGQARTPQEGASEDCCVQAPTDTELWHSWSDGGVRKLLGRESEEANKRGRGMP